VGAVTGPLFLYCKDGENNGFTLPRLILWATEINFPIASKVNLSLISLERLQATLFPCRHCLITKWFYFKLIAGSWLIIFSIAVVMTIVSQEKFPYAWASFNVLTLIVITISYVIIIVNVQRSSYSQNHGSVEKERKLSITLFIVTAVCVVTILPWIVFSSMPIDLKTELSYASNRVKILELIIVIYFASSVVNPLVYAIRMQEFRKAIREIVCKRTEPTRVIPLNPHPML